MGVTGQAFIAMFDEMNNFLKMDPVVESPFPDWMRRSRLEAQVIETKTLKEFCELAAGGGDGDFQVHLLRSWIVRVAQQSESEATLIKAVCEGSNAAALSSLDDACQTQACALVLLMRPESISAKDLDNLGAALQLVEDGQTAVAALLTYPHGRTVVKSARARNADLLALEKSQASVLACCQSLVDTSAACAMQLRPSESESPSVGQAAANIKTLTDAVHNFQQAPARLGIDPAVFQDSLDPGSLFKVQMCTPNVAYCCIASFWKLRIWEFADWADRKDEQGSVVSLLEAAMRPSAIKTSLTDESVEAIKLCHSILTQLPQYLESAGPSWGVEESAKRISLANGLLSGGGTREHFGGQESESDWQQLDAFLRSFFGGLERPGAARYAAVAKSMSELAGRVVEGCAPIGELAQGFRLTSAPQQSLKVWAGLSCVLDAKEHADLAAFLGGLGGRVKTGYDIISMLMKVGAEAGKFAAWLSPEQESPALSEGQISPCDVGMGFVTSLAKTLSMLQPTLNHAGPLGQVFAEEGVVGQVRPIDFKGLQKIVPVVVPLLQQQCRDMIAGYATHFVSRVSLLSDAMDGMVSRGWATDKLLDTEGSGADMRVSLLKNPHYPKLAAGGEKLSGACSSLSKLNDLGLGVFVPLEVLKKGKEVAAECLDCAGYTYLCYMLTVHIPTKVSEKVKADELSRLKKWARAKFGDRLMPGFQAALSLEEQPAKKQKSAVSRGQSADGDGRASSAPSFSIAASSVPLLS